MSAQPVKHQGGLCLQCICNPSECSAELSQHSELVWSLQVAALCIQQVHMGAHISAFGTPQVLQLVSTLLLLHHSYQGRLYGPKLIPYSTCLAVPPVYLGHRDRPAVCWLSFALA